MTALELYGHFMTDDIPSFSFVLQWDQDTSILDKHRALEYLSSKGLNLSDWPSPSLPPQI